MIADIQAIRPWKSTLFSSLFPIFGSIFATLCIFVVPNMPLSNLINTSWLALWGERGRRAAVCPSQTVAICIMPSSESCKTELITLQKKVSDSQCFRSLLTPLLPPFCPCRWMWQRVFCDSGPSHHDERTSALTDERANPSCPGLCN